MDADQIARCLRTRLLAVLVVILALGSVAVGCGDGAVDSAAAPVASPPAEVPTSAPGTDRSAGRVALVETDAGLAAVPAGTSAPTWVVSGAVAAPDGSAVFSVRRAPEAGGSGVQLLRIDPVSGAARPVGPPLLAPSGVHVAAVEPGGERVVLVAPDAGTGGTRVVDVDGTTGIPVREPVFEGTLEPEAYSTDRSLLFAARVYDDRYHVHALELADGTQWPTLGLDKTVEPEDMYGAVVQAALSPDGTQLATLYRDATKPGRTAFVHLLSLETGTTVCVDLKEPFGGDEPGRDAIEWRDDGTVAVGHTADDPDRSVTATFDPAAIWSGEAQLHYHAETVADPDPPSVPDGVAATPGFRRFVAIATTAAPATP